MKVTLDIRRPSERWYSPPATLGDDERRDLLVLWILGAGVATALRIVVYLLALRGRRVPGEHVFRASRWSRGNHVFPTQVAVTPTSVVHYTPAWFGRHDQSIHMAHVASVRIDTNL